MRKLVFLFLFSITSTVAFCSQLRDTVPIIQFQLIDAADGRPIPLAHVMNITSNRGTIADMQGFFQIRLATGDTLHISAVGYHDMNLPSWGQFSSDSLYYPLRLTPRSYAIRAVKILRFGTYQRFIKEAATMEMPKSEAEIVKERLDEYFRKTITRMELKGGPPHGGGFVFGKDWLSIQREKIEAKRAEEQKWDIILKKFSAGIINELTGLEGVDAIKFMEYCGFSEGYLLIASDYEIRKRILDIFEIYKKLHLSSIENDHSLQISN